ncbi:putative nucleoredoxin 1 [Apostasia shenzhenica]|uniref:protein-disulfide reductase n=1 Tax=Apostasia shenzhenica TaxID=1088818 RepID=A0A2I0A9W1_9ASPA|nr:putative nucleoredoxin 1 [Apostasia shenzhenica]
MAADKHSGQRHDLQSLLAGDGRDFLVRSNGDQVKIHDLKGKTTALFFSASWCPPCRKFNPKLTAAYSELLSQGQIFEIVFISRDRSEEQFNDYFSGMPWLAIPFKGSSDLCKIITELFDVEEIPTLVILDSDGNVLTGDAVQLVKDHGIAAYPFSPEKISKCVEVKEAARRNQTLESLLASPSRDYLVSNDGSKVLISDLHGKIILMYFASKHYKQCSDFTPKLIKMYKQLKEKKDSVEVVLVSLASVKISFEEEFKEMPWLAIPFEDENRRDDLAYYFEVLSIPSLVVIGQQGKTIHPNAVDFVEEYGLDAYPVSEKFVEFVEKEKERSEAQTIETLLTAGELDYVIRTDGNKVPVSELNGKTILLYFSASNSHRCQKFQPKLIEAYHKIKERDDRFEVVLVCHEHAQKTFDEFFAAMPWLAVPHEDKRIYSLLRKSAGRSLPVLLAVGPGGRTVCNDAKELIVLYGADAYPFTVERVKELEAMTCDGEEAACGVVCEGDDCCRV